MKKKQLPPLTRPKSIRQPASVQAAPHSWLLNEWTEVAPHVAPNKTEAAKHLVRFHRDELIAAGAIARFGRELVVLGGPYTAWMRRRTALVADYQLPMNASKHTNGEPRGAASN